jgi:SH3-like domain-containing protein
MSPSFFNNRHDPADDHSVMVRVRVAEWSAPTLPQRVVILVASHLLTLLGLLVWSIGGAGSPSTAPAAIPLARSAPLTIHAGTASFQAVTAASAAESPLRPANVARPVAIVVNTEGRGVWLRRDPAGDPLTVWPDGAPMTIVGPSRAADGHDWHSVRTADGQVGWVVADYLAGTDAAVAMDAVGLVTPSGFAPAVVMMRAVPATASRAVG